MLFGKEHIYIIQEPQDFGTHIFKVGRSGKVLNRMKSYPNGSQIIEISSVRNCKESEKILINNCKENFGRPVRGNEYFNCENQTELIDIFNKTVYDGRLNDYKESNILNALIKSNIDESYKTLIIDIIKRKDESITFPESISSPLIIRHKGFTNHLCENVPEKKLSVESKKRGKYKKKKEKKEKKQPWKPGFVLEAERDEKMRKKKETERKLLEKKELFRRKVEETNRVIQNAMDQKLAKRKAKSTKRYFKSEEAPKKQCKYMRNITKKQGDEYYQKKCIKNCINGTDYCGFHKNGKFTIDQ